MPRSFVGREFIPEKDPLIEEVTEWSQLVAMLRYDRLDAVVLPALLVQDLFGPDVVRVFQQTAGTLPVSLYLSNANLESEVVDRIKRAVKSCRAGDLVSELR
jgi:polar amino acid transport system substrate-binding protein